MVFKSNVEIAVPKAWGGIESQAIRYSKGGSALPPTYLAFIIAFIWGLSPVLFKFFLHQSVPTYLIIFFQAFVYLISSVIYMLIWKRTEIGIDLQKYKNYIPFLIIVPFFSVYIANYLYIYALENKGNINVMAITISLAPVVTMIFSYFIFREMLSLKAFIGFFIIIVGLLLIFTGGGRALPT
jgi:drug/metabolite transporter (DMT)-like permease